MTPSQPFFFSLVEVLLIKVQYPDDQMYSSWTAGTVDPYKKILKSDE